MLRQATLLLCGAAAVASDSMSSFVTRSGAQLMLDNEPFRFAGANMYWLGLDENVANATTGSKIGYPLRGPNRPPTGRVGFEWGCCRWPAGARKRLYAYRP